MVMPAPRSEVPCTCHDRPCAPAIITKSDVNQVVHMLLCGSMEQCDVLRGSKLQTPD